MQHGRISHSSPLSIGSAWLALVEDALAGPSPLVSDVSSRLHVAYLHQVLHAWCELQREVLLGGYS